MPKYFSGRVKRTPQSGLTSDRYQYLGLDQAEPNLGDPPEVDNIPGGQQYQIVSVANHPGERYWKTIGGGVVPGAITVRNDGTILPNVSGGSSITELNIKGNILTAVGTLDPDGNPGTAVTITAAPIGNDHEVIFNNNGEFGAASGLSYDNNNSRVGIASTQPQESLDIDGTLFITGNVFDKTHDSGDTDQVLVRSATGGLVWADQSGSTAVAAGHTTQVQFHNDDGNLGGAAKLVYDYTNERIGIGSTQPTKLLDVLGDSKFKGRTDFDGNVHIDGVLTYEDVTNVDSIGVVTAGKGVRITSEGLIVAGITTLDTTRFPDNTSLYFGADDDLEIKHDGNDSIINDNVNGSLKLQQNGNTRLEVTGMGVTISGVTTTNVLSVTGLVTSHLIPSPASVGLFDLGSQNNRWDYLYVNNIDTGSWSPIVITAEQLRITGLSTFEGLTRHQDGIVVTSGVSTFVGFTTFNNNIFVTGVSTFVGVSTFNDDLSVGDDFIVAGLSTFVGVTTSKSTLFAKQFSSGISTLGIASATDLYVSGLSTFHEVATYEDGINVTSGVSTFVGFSTFTTGVHVTGFSTFVGISSFEGNVSFNAGIRDKDGDLGGPTDGFILESTNNKINWVNPQGLSVESANKIGVGSVYGGPPLTAAGINTYFVTFVPDNNPINGREKEELYTTGLFVYDPIGQRVGIGTTIPSDTLSVDGTTSFKGSVSFDGVQNNVGFTSLTWQSSAGRLKFQDEVWASFGDGNDLRIYHTEALKGEVDNNGDPITDNTNCSYIHEKGSGGLVFKSDGGGGPGAFQFFDQNWNPLLKLHSGNNARVLLYHNGAERLLTTDAGIKVSGLTTTSSLRLDGAFYDSSNSYGASSGYILETNQASGVSWVNPTDLAFGKANKVGIGSINAADVGIGTHFITFVDTNNPHDGRDYEKLYSTGLFVYDPQDGGRVGIGTTIPSDTLSVAGISSFNGEVYFNSGVTGITSIGWSPSNSALEFKDNVKATFGDINSLTVQNGGSQTHSKIIHENSINGSHLYIRSSDNLILDSTNTNNWIRGVQGGATELYWNENGNKKFETSGVGVTVYGSVSIYDSDASHKITLQPPATSSLTADYALTLPVDDGDINEVLTTDGNGVLSWTTKAAGTAVAAGSNQQVQYNNNNVLAGAAELLFDNSTTAPTLILKPNVTTTSTNGGYIQVRNAGSTNTTLNAATINHDGGLELKRTNESVTGGGPYIDFKYDADDMDARIQMDIVGGTTSDSKFSAIKFLTGGGDENTDNGGSGNVKERLRIGKAGEIGIDASNGGKTSAEIYGTSGQVLKSAGDGASVYWGTEGTGSGLAAVQVKQYSDDLSQNNPRTERTCDALDAPITVATSSGTAVIGIGSTSNAYGNRYIGTTEPTGNLCEGDIWYDTSASGGVSDSTGITKVALLEYRTDSGTDDLGSITPNTWTSRALSYKVDPQSFVTFPVATDTSNTKTEFSLGSGTYRIKWSVPAVRMDRHQTSLRYSTDSTFSSYDRVLGTSEVVEDNANNTIQTRSFGETILTLTDRTYFKMYSIVDATNNTAVRGYNTAKIFNNNTITGGVAPDESVYTQISIEDLATAVKEVDVVNTGITRVALIKDAKNYDKNGGGFTKDAWRDRDLTEIEDPQGFVNFNSNGGTKDIPSTGLKPGYWSLQPGTYKIEWSAPAYEVNRHQTKLVYSTTEEQISASGLHALASSVEGSTENTTWGSLSEVPTQTRSFGSKVIKITEPTWFKIMHLCTENGANNNTNSFGRRLGGANDGNPDNIYTEVRIEDLATAIKEVDVVNTGITKVALLKDQKGSQIHGGTFTEFGWRDRDLTVKEDPYGFVNFTEGGTQSDESGGDTPGYFSLPAGTYKIEWEAPGMNVNRHQSKLVWSIDSTKISAPGLDSTIVNAGDYAQGSSENTTGGAWTGTPEGTIPTSTHSTGCKIITITQPTWFKILHYCNRTLSSTGFGQRVASSLLTTDFSIYTQVRIEDLATAVKNAGDEYVSGNTRVAVVKDQKNKGIQGGNFGNNAWRDRDLTVKDDPFSFVTLYPSVRSNGADPKASISLGDTPGYFSLPAGKYKITFSAVAHDVGRNTAAMLWSSTESNINKAYATTDSRDGEFYGTSMACAGASTLSKGSEVVEISQTSFFKVIHYAKSTNNGSGFGQSTDIGNPDKETYLIIEIEDLATAVKDVVNTGITRVATIKDQRAVTAGNPDTDHGGPAAIGPNIRKFNTLDDTNNIGITLHNISGGWFPDNPSTAQKEDELQFATIIKVPAGTYRIKWSAPAWNVDLHNTVLQYSTSDSVNANGRLDSNVSSVQGSSEFSATEEEITAAAWTGGNTNKDINHTASSSFGTIASITFTQDTYIQLSHWCEYQVTSPYGLGSGNYSASAGDSVFAQIEIEDLATAVKDQAPAGSDVPVGGIIMYSGTKPDLDAMANWKLCDGTTYGSVTTPNLKDKFVIGADSWSTANAGRWETNVTQSGTQSGGSKDAIIGNHAHTFGIYNGGDDMGTSQPPIQGDSSNIHTVISTSDAKWASADVGESLTNKNLPPYFALAYIMRIS